MQNENFSYEKMKNFIFKNIIFIVIFIVSAIYIITSFLKIEETGKTLLQIIGESTLVFLFSYFILQAFSLQGIIKGEESKEIIEDRKELNLVKENIGKNISKLSSWLTQKNKITEEEYKNLLLCDYGIAYSDLIKNNFDKSKLTKREIKKINKIKNKKLTKLCAGELLNETYKKNDPLYLGKTKSVFLKERNLSGLSTKILFTLLFGYFSTSFIGFNPSEIIWKFFQVGLFLIFGVMEYFRSYMYMTVEYHSTLRKKISLLKEFNHYTKEIEDE